MIRFNLVRIFSLLLD